MRRVKAQGELRVMRAGKLLIVRNSKRRQAHAPVLSHPRPPHGSAPSRRPASLRSEQTARSVRGTVSQTKCLPPETRFEPRHNEHATPQHHSRSRKARAREREPYSCRCRWSSPGPSETWQEAPRRPACCGTGALRSPETPPVRGCQAAARRDQARRAFPRAWRRRCKR